jgi:hypothetical protein
MDSRRPERRASSEKTPGVSETGAADIAARLKAPNVLMWWFASAITNDVNACYEIGLYIGNPPGSWKRAFAAHASSGHKDVLERG